MAWIGIVSLRSSRASLRTTTLRRSGCAASWTHQGTYLINLMSSPGSGKTTTLLRLLPLLQRQLRVGVMEADIDSDVDADTVSRTGAKVIQLHTGGMCHLDAGMTREGLQQLEPAGLDLVILENVGNLVCRRNSTPARI